MRTLTVVTLLGAAALLAGGEAIAADPVVAGSGIDPATASDAPPPRATQCSFTQNTLFEIMPGGSLACQNGATTDNQYLRIFDLDGEHGFGGVVCIDSLDYAVETSSGSVDLTFNVYCTRQGLADDATIEDAIERLYFLAKIEKGIREADAGLTVSHDEAKKRLGGE